MVRPRNRDVAGRARAGLPVVADPFLAILAALAIPAALGSVAVVGAGQFVLGRPPSLGVGLVARGDLPFLVAASLFAVAVGYVVTRVRRDDEAPEVEQWFRPADRTSGFDGATAPSRR